MEFKWILLNNVDVLFLFSSASDSSALRISYPITSLAYKNHTNIPLLNSFEHIKHETAASEVKMEITITETRQEAFLILTMANTIELEGEMKLRFTALYSMNKSVKVPYPMYVFK